VEVKVGVRRKRREASIEETAMIVCLKLGAICKDE
jgi:hypothetical protein